ncbi:hypothetical protein GA0116948_11366 [Chitinophaga costaii]|uniref:Uncharacterized protein n=1 Tax=Chitinophaga costaii TaxID=1335309 RepID=A0A1C4FDU9_9BACT|nr:hypothetical protein GA0116948_11366 [Chitinophaga costaii]
MLKLVNENEKRPEFFPGVFVFIVTVKSIRLALLFHVSYMPLR